MGCVFLEMATVLMGRTLDDLEAYYASRGTTSRNFYKNEEATESWIEELKLQPDLCNQGVLDWTKSMLKEAQKDRPTASQVVAKISDAVNDERRYFCFDCLDDATYEIGHDSHHVSDSDMMNGVILQSYLRHDSAQDNDTDDDTVTSKFLEEKGLVSVVTEIESPGENLQAKGPDLTQERDHAIPCTVANGNSAQERSCSEAHSATLEQVSEGRTLNEQEGDIAKDRTGPVTPILRSSIKTPGAPSTNKEVRFEQEHQSVKELPKLSGRFLLLPFDRRPLPSKPVEAAVDLDEMPIVAPEPLRLPPLDSQDCYPLPKATLVPSYILAGANRFSLKEVRDACDISMGSRNLFVYGRLMFPSVLRAFAARSTQGVYSPIHQRRLVPSSKDWAFVDMSVKQAAEAMTPARLKKFDAWRPSRMQLSAIQKSSRTDEILSNRDRRGLPSLTTAPLAEVSGFLILGVMEEALRYCDLVFTSDMESLKQARPEAKEEDGIAPIGGFFERKLINVEVQLTTGEYRSVPASTYVWSQDVNHLHHPWRPEDFVRGAGFQDICNAKGVDWRGEEMALAETMKIAYALVGDELCSAILADDSSRLQDLLDDYDDVDARCRKYGTPLQAAVAVGNDDMVQLLLERHANPSAEGGKYGTPLIAATMGKRKSIVRLLLKYRANIFASHPQYVNALYQAVGSSDSALTEMILEAGGWLSKDYGEIRDLAIEKRDRDLQALLVEYDVRDVYRLRLEERKIDSQIDRRRGEVGFIKKYGPVTKAVLKKFFVVSGQSGSVRGRKGVAITRAALAAGAPPMILDHIRNAINPVMKLIDTLKAADEQQRLLRKAEMERTGRVEELGSDDEAGDEDEKSPLFRIEEPNEQQGATSRELVASHLSRQSSDSSIDSRRSHDSRGAKATEKKQVRSHEEMYPKFVLDVPPRQSQYSSPRTSSPSHLPNDCTNLDARRTVPQIVTPSFVPPPPRRSSPSEERLPFVSSRYAPRNPAHGNPQYLVSCAVWSYSIILTLAVPTATNTSARTLFG